MSEIKKVLENIQPIIVIPVKTGIQRIQKLLDSCFRRSDRLIEFLNL